jgi:hypothetical protein
MGETQPQSGSTHQLPTRSRAPSSARAGVGFGSATQNNHSEHEQDNEMRPSGHPRQLTRSRAPSTVRGGARLDDSTRGDPRQQDHQVNSAPQRVRGLRQEDFRQNHSTPSNRRNGEEYEETDRDEVVENANPQPRGRSRTLPQHPDSFQSGPPPQHAHLVRGRSTAPPRDQQQPNTSFSKDHYPPSREAELHPRHIDQDVLDARRRAMSSGIAQAPAARVGYRASALPLNLRDDGRTLTRSRSVEPPKGIHDVLVNQIVSAVSEENAVLVSIQYHLNDARIDADYIEREVGQLPGEMRSGREAGSEN